MLYKSIKCRTHWRKPLLRRFQRWCEVKEVFLYFRSNEPPLSSLTVAKNGCQTIGLKSNFLAVILSIFAMKEDYQLLTNKVRRGLWCHFASLPSNSALHFGTVKTITLPGGGAGGVCRSEIPSQRKSDGKTHFGNKAHCTDMKITLPISDCYCKICSGEFFLGAKKCLSIFVLQRTERRGAPFAMTRSANFHAGSLWL